MKLVAIGLLMLMLGNMVVLTVPEARADTPTENTWIATTTKYASDPTAWQNGSLQPGQKIWFIDAYDGSCNWNVSGAFGDFIIKTGYAGTITQQVSFTIGSFIQYDGTFTPSNDYRYPITITGDWIVAGGSFGSYSYPAYLIFTRDGAVLKSYASTYFNGLHFYGNATLTKISSGVSYYFGKDTNAHLIIEAGKTLTMNMGGSLVYMTYYSYSGSVYNNGTIRCLDAGVFLVRLYQTNRTLNLGRGVWSVPLSIELISATTANRTLYLTDNLTIGSSVSIFSSSSQYKITLKTNGYAISTSSHLTVGNRAILDADSSTITCSGNWDSSAGTFLAGSSSVHLTGSAKTLKTAGTSQPFANLFVDGSYTLQSNVWARNLTINGTLTTGSYKMNVTNDLTARGVWSGSIYLNNTTPYDVETTMPYGTSQYLYFASKTTIRNGTTGSVIITPPSGTFLQTRFTKLVKSPLRPDWVAKIWASMSVSGTVNFELEEGIRISYNIYVDGSLLASKTVDEDGYLRWSYSTWSAHWFNVSMNEGIASTPSTTSVLQDHAWSYTIVFAGTPTSISISRPSWLMWSLTNYTLWGTPRDMNVGEWAINITAHFSTYVAYQNFTLTIINIQPVFTSTAPTSAFVYTWLTYQASTTDSAWGGSWRISTNAPFTTTVSPSGFVSILPTSTGLFWFNLTYVDQSGADNNTAYQFFIIEFRSTGPGGGAPPGFTANFTFTISGNTVTFTDTSTGTAIISWFWTFGDGATSAQQNPKHTYAKPGSYMVTLEVQDSLGRAASISKVVKIGSEQKPLVTGDMLTLISVIIIILGVVGAISDSSQEGRLAYAVVIFFGIVMFLWRFYT